MTQNTKHYITRLTWPNLSLGDIIWPNLKKRDLTWLNQS